MTWQMDLVSTEITMARRIKACGSETSNMEKEWRLGLMVCNTKECLTPARNRAKARLPFLTARYSKANCTRTKSVALASTGGPTAENILVGG